MCFAVVLISCMIPTYNFAECDEESNGFGGKSDGNEGGMQLTATRAMATVTAMTWLMAKVTRRAGDEEGKGEGGKGDGEGDEGSGR